MNKLSITLFLLLLTGYALMLSGCFIITMNYFDASAWDVAKFYGLQALYGFFIGGLGVLLYVKAERRAHGL